jgi:transcriptional regulator with XRE-family HTH domain
MLSQSNFLVLAAAIRAGRGALSWSQQELAERSGVSLPTVARVETSSGSPKLETVSRLIGAIERGGVKFEWNQVEGFTMVFTLHKS